MPDSTDDNKQRLSTTFNVGSVLATTIYVVTVIMILAYLYQSLSAVF